MSYEKRMFTCDEAKRICKEAFETGTDCGRDSMRYYADTRTSGWKKWLEQNEQLLFAPMSPIVDDVLQDFQKWCASNHEHVHADTMHDDDKVLSCDQVRQLCRKAFDDGFTYGVKWTRYRELASRYDWSHWLKKNKNAFPTLQIVEDDLR